MVSARALSAESPAPPLLVITGPTAAGKSALVSALCRRFPLEIISADAVQVYRGLDIGSAKPGPTERATAPHHLIDILPPCRPYSAAAFRADALRVAHEVTARGNIPALVGGTMFYLRAFESGLSQLPAANLELRSRIEDEARTHGWQALHDKLRRIDPAAAARIDPADRQRIQRALEVPQLSGTPLSALQGRQPAPPPYRITRLALTPANRAVLHRRIESRFDAMLSAGLVEETRALLCDEKLSPELPALRAVGYAQVGAYVRGEYDHEQMRRNAIAATRQLAKRQLGWLRHNGGTVWINSEIPAHTVASATLYIENVLAS